MTSQASRAMTMLPPATIAIHPAWSVSTVRRYRKLATLLASVADNDWQRTGRRSNGATFTVETLGKYFIHDLTHHLHDVRG